MREYTFPRMVNDIPKKYTRPYMGNKIYTSIDGAPLRINGKLRLDGKLRMLDYKASTEQEKAMDRNGPLLLTARDDNSRVFIPIYDEYLKVHNDDSVDSYWNRSFFLDLTIISKTPSVLRQSIDYIEGYIPGLERWVYKDKDILDFKNPNINLAMPKKFRRSVKVRFGSLKADIVLNLALDFVKDRVNNKLIIGPDSRVRINFEEPLGLNQILGAARLFNCMEDFFNFIFNAPYSASVLTGGLSSQPKCNNIYIVKDMSPNNNKIKRDEGTYGIYECFYMQDISNLQTLVQNWCESWRQDQVTRTILTTLGSLHPHSRGGSASFINLINNVEKVYSFIDQGNGGVPTHKCPECATKLSGSSLRSKLNDLFATGKKYGLYRMSNSTKKGVIDGIIKGRNYHTHGIDTNPEGKSNNRPLSGLAMLQANTLLIDHLRLILLERIGTNEVELKKIVNRFSSTEIEQYVMR